MRNSSPDVVKGDSGHEKSDGEVTSIPFPVNKKKRIKKNESTDMT